MNEIISAGVEHIDHSILLIRGKEVLLDLDLSIIYGVPTKRLNEQVRRNLDRFPPDFMFQVTYDEKKELIAKYDRLTSLKFSSQLPYAFTEHGSIMLAAVLRSGIATEVSVQVVRAFVKLRQQMNANRELVDRLDDLESKYDGQFDRVFAQLRGLIQGPSAPDPKPLQLKSKRATKAAP